jgi:hypothetical protein
VSGGKKSQQSCPKQKGTIAVVFVRSDIGKPIQGAAVAVQGPTPGSGTTDNLGAVVLKDRAPGPYTARVSLPASMKSYGMTLETTKGSVSAGGSEILLFKAAPVGNLLIEVCDDRGKLVTEEATLSASGAAGLSHTGKTGTHTFAKVPAGAYEVFASVPGMLFEVPSVSQKAVFVAEGATQKVKLEVKRFANIVTPKIESEYKVVVLDRKLSSHQEAAEKKIVADDVTYLRVSATQSTGQPAYTGEAKLEVSPANVELYTDKDCRNKLAGKIKNADLVGGKLDLYLKAKTKGKFTAKLTLDPANDPHVSVRAPASEEMAVVELESTLHRFDKADLDALALDPGTDPAATYHTKLKDKALPAQKAMSDADKVKLGRMLHVQKDGHHGRAKLVLKKLAAADWPADTDAYDVVLECDKASLELFDKEFAGAEKNLPLKIKLKDLKAKEVELWVQGKSASEAARDAVLHLGLDRGAGGLAHKPKKHADWSRFTVVDIKEVKFAFASGANQPLVWDAVKGRYFINTDEDKKGRELKSDAAKGRTVKMEAALTHPLKDVTVHFMLANDKDNYTKAYWGAGVPASFDWGKLDKSLKALDRAAPAKVLHVSAKTEVNGVAECKELALSRLGGDKFRIGAYIDQDAHLAKYVDGHTDLGKKKPALSDELQVWRKAFMQISRNKTAVLPGRGSTITAFEKAYTLVREIDETEYDPTKIAGLTEHPKWQFEAGDASGKKIICVGAHNKTKFHGLFKAAAAATTPKAHLVMCDAQWDPEAGTSQDFNLTKREQAVNYKNAAGNDWSGIFDPPLSGGSLLQAGAFEWNDGTNLHKGNVTVEVRQARTHTSEVRIKIPATCPATCVCGGGTAMAPGAAKPAKATIRLKGSSGPWAGESGSKGSPHCLIVVDSNSSAFNNTIAHELGHMFGQVREQKNWLGLPNHPDQYTRRGGQGSHCKKGASEHATEVDEIGNKVYVNGTCIMYGTAVGNLAFCDNCEAELRVRDMSDFFK